MKKSIILLILLSPVLLTAQSLTKVNKYYDDFNYYKVIKTIGSNDKISTDLSRKLADSYKMVGDYKNSENVYARVVSAPDKTPSDVYAYAQVLKTNGKYQDAETQMDAYAASNASEKRVELYKQNKAAMKDLMTDKGQFAIKNIEMNSAEQEFGVIYYKDQVIFASTRRTPRAVYRRWNANNKPFLNLYAGTPSATDDILEPKEFGNFNKKYHEGPASFNKTGTLMFYTSDNYSNKSTTGYSKLALYEVKFISGRYGNVQEKIYFDYNSKDYNTGHPALSADGNTLYFVSDMPGGKGGTDIYKCTKNPDGTWAKPVNVGDKINTEGNEMFPFIHESGMFFFSSDGHPGLGGLDIFATEIKDGQFRKIINVGVPVNSSRDDFSMIINEAKSKGYFASNREEGKGSDDIYSFHLHKPFVFGKTIKGVARDKENNILAGTLVTLTDENGALVHTITTAEDGAYSFNVDENKNFKLTGKKDKYFDDTKNLSTEVSTDEVAGDLQLEKDPGLMLHALVSDRKTGANLDGVVFTITDKVTGKTETITTDKSGAFNRPLTDKKTNDQLDYEISLEKQGYLKKTVSYSKLIDKHGVFNVHEVADLKMDVLEAGADLAKMINMKPIYFDLGKFKIRKDAALELDKIVKIMNDYPDMVVELGSHSDCRGGAAANLKLSDKRAKASAAYIKSQISKPERISGKGYGESALLNSCACEGKVKSTCSEDEHSANRRTEFKIIKLK